ALALLWWATARSTLPFTVRVVSTGPADDLGAYARALGIRDPDRLPRDAPRGADTGGVSATVADFLQRVDEREREREQLARHAPVPTVAAEFVTVRFVADFDCSALVLMLAADGRLVRRYPAPPGAAVFGEVADTFAAGTVHTLPRPVVIARDSFAVSMDPG